MVYHFLMMRRLIASLLVSSMVSSSLSPVFAGIDDDNPETTKSVTASPVGASSYYNLAERETVLSQRLNHWEDELARAKTSRGQKRNRIRRINHAANMVEGVWDVLKTFSTQKRKLAGTAVFSQSPITNLIFGEQERWERMNLTAYEREQAKLVSKSWYHAVKRAEKDSGRFRLEPLHLGSFYKGEKLAQRYAHLVIEGYVRKTVVWGETTEVPAFLSDIDTSLITSSPCLQSVDLRVQDFRAVEMLLLSMNPLTELHVEIDQPFGEQTAARPNDASFSGFMTWMRCMTSMTCYPAHSSRPEHPSHKAPDYDPKGTKSWLDYQRLLNKWAAERMKEISVESHPLPPKPRRGLKDLASLAVSFQSAIDAVVFLEELYLQLDLKNKWGAPPRLQKIVLFINQYVSDFSSDLDMFGFHLSRRAEVADDVRAQLKALQKDFGSRLQLFTKNDVFEGVQGNLEGDTLPSFSVAGILPVVMPILKLCRGVGFRIEFLKVLSCVRPSTLDAVLSLIRKSVFLGPSFQDSLEGTYVHPDTVSAVAELTPSYRASALEGICVVFADINSPRSHRYQWIDQIRHCILFFGLIPPPDHRRIFPYLEKLFYYQGGFNQHGGKQIQEAVSAIPRDERADVICHAVPGFFDNTSVDDKVGLLKAFHRIPKADRTDIRERTLKYSKATHHYEAQRYRRYPIAISSQDLPFIINTLALISREKRDEVDAFVFSEVECNQEYCTSHFERFTMASSQLPPRTWSIAASEFSRHQFGFSVHEGGGCWVKSPIGIQHLALLCYEQGRRVFCFEEEWCAFLHDLFRQYQDDDSCREQILEGLLTVVPLKRFPVLKRLQQIYKIEARLAKEKHDSEKSGCGYLRWNGAISRTGIKTHLVPLMKALEDYTDEEFEEARPFIQGYVDELALMNYYSRDLMELKQSTIPQYAPIFAGLRKVDQGDWKELFKVMGRVIDGGRVPANLSKRDFIVESMDPSSRFFWKNFQSDLRKRDDRLAEEARQRALNNRPPGSRPAVWF